MIEEKWHDVWIQSGMGEIYADNNIAMPLVTGDPTKQPPVSSWMRILPCGCTVFYKGYCLHTSNECEKHCRKPFGRHCFHGHGKRLVTRSEDRGQYVAVHKEWV
jgi:hypothetical protein